MMARGKRTPGGARDPLDVRSIQHGICVALKRSTMINISAVIHPLMGAVFVRVWMTRAIIGNGAWVCINMHYCANQQLCLAWLEIGIENFPHQDALHIAYCN